MLNYYLFRLGQFLALNLPLGASYAIAVIFSDFRLLFAHKDKFEVRRNLRVIFPDKSRKELDLIMVNCFRNFAKYLVDFFRFSLIDKSYIEKKVRIEHIEYLNQAQQKGKGVIVLTAHMGIWELGGVVLSQLKYPFWAIAMPHKNKKVNDFFNFQRESKGVNVIAFGKAVRQSLLALAKNELVALVGDRDYSKEKGVVVDFFGKPTSFPKGPAAFCLKTGAPIVAGFMLRNSDNSFTLRFEKLIEPVTYKFAEAANEKISFNADQEYLKALQRLTSQYKEILQRYIREFPDQWFIFRRFWIEHNS